MGKKQNILDFAFFFLLLLAVQAFKISHLEDKVPDSKPAQKSADLSSSSYSTTIFISPVFSLQPKLSSFDLQKLDQKQKDVDKFIRQNTQVGDSKLTEAKGNGNYYVFNYEKESDQKDELWIVSVTQVPETDKKEQEKEGQKKEQEEEGQKFLITGINYIKNSKLSEQEKKKIEEELKKSEQEFKQSEREFKEQMEEFGKGMEEFFRSW